MIDTEKYEGHTPAPWKAIDDSPKVTAGTGPFEGKGAREHESWWVELNEARCNTHSGQWQRRIGASYMTMRDAKLIADAPLLLEEVKKLREELLVHRKAWGETEYRLEMAEDVLGRSDWFSVYSELIKEEGE